MVFPIPSWSILSLIFCLVKGNELLIATLSFSAGYYSVPIFYNSKSSNCIGALSFFKDVKSNCSDDFGHAEKRSGAKKRVVLRLEIFFARF